MKQVSRFIFEEKFFICDPSGKIKYESCDSYAQALKDKWEYGDDCIIIQKTVYVNRENIFFPVGLYSKNYLEVK